MYTKQELIDILKTSSLNQALFAQADKVRRETVGDWIHLRGLIEFSNNCNCFCKYCGLRCENKELERYRLSTSQILHLAQNAVNLGYKTIVLQGGEDKFFDRDKMCEIITEIKKFDVALTLSIGERSYEDYKAFKDCGADRYLIRIETTDKELYSRMHPNMSFDNRLRCLENLKELGYEVGTGCLVGLEGQTIESLANDILFFKEIDADMIGIGPFIAHPNTPLKGAQNGDFWLALKVMALVRIMQPNINIPATTAMETLKKDGRLIALQSGANVVMPNVTDDISSVKYEIYPDKAGIKDSSSSRKCVEEMIASIGRKVGEDYGFRKTG